MHVVQIGEYIINLRNVAHIRFTQESAGELAGSGSGGERPIAVVTFVGDGLDEADRRLQFAGDAIAALRALASTSA